MIIAVTPILLIQEAKAFNTQKCFDQPKPRNVNGLRTIALRNNPMYAMMAK